ncbi:MAG: hypothetical protein LBK06_10095 [Planctomycetaceae bacterium]|jgi:hypothetical protein|nr:hypothetical protein [Planctomycetaceae bacterium]
MTTDVSDIISAEKDYYAFFAKAEKHLKNAETFFPAEIIEQGLLVPAINELRYAGFHAASALTLSGAEKIVAYQKAIAHCKRASYDSLDASIQFCFSLCQTFREDYRLITVSDVIPDYSESRGRLDDIADDIKQHTTKEARWECMEEYFNEVNTISKR